MSPPKHVDLLVLAAAAVVFVLADFPLLGYAAAAAVWLAQRGIQWLAQRRSNEALKNGNRQRAMGIIAATDARPGLADGDRGPARRHRPAHRRALLGDPPGGPLHDLDGLLRPRLPARAGRPEGAAAMRRGDEPDEDENQSPDRPRHLPGDRDRPAPDLRQRRQERRLQTAERVQAAGLGPPEGRPARPLDQPRGLLPRSGQRADDHDDDLHRQTDDAEAEPGPDRGRALLRTGEKQHPRRQPRQATSPNAGSPSSPPSSSSSGSRT